jgi:hypothetical protein
MKTKLKMDTKNPISVYACYEGGAYSTLEPEFLEECILATKDFKIKLTGEQIKEVFDTLKGWKKHVTLQDENDKWNPKKVFVFNMTGTESHEAGIEDRYFDLSKL